MADTNPFALVTAAHLFTRKTKGNPEERYAAKWRLAKLLCERHWDKQRIINLFSVIDWLMRLPAAVENHSLGRLIGKPAARLGHESRLEPWANPTVGTTAGGGPQFVQHCRGKRSTVILHGG